MGSKNQTRKNVHAGGSPKGAVLLVMVLAAVMILAIAAFRVAADADGGKTVGSHVPSQTPAPSPAVELRDTKHVTAIVERVDMETKTLQLYNVQEHAVLWLSYESRTDIVDKYGLVIVAGQLLPGDIVEVEYEAKSSMAVSVSVSPDIWEHRYQTELTVGTGRQMLSVGGRNFIYSDALHIYNNGVQEELSYLLKEDSITLRGMGSEVYVILLERGHGYLTLKEEQDYIGGSILANNQYISQITDDLVLTLREGTYDITVENDDLRATIQTTVARDQTTVLDLTEYVRVPDPVGQVTFKIQPVGAVLWINDENRFYGKPVELAYGIYKIRVESGGYVPYEGLLRVESAASELVISLPEAPVATPTPEGDFNPTPTPAGTEGTGSGGNTGNGDTGSSGTVSGDSQDNTSEQQPGEDGSYPMDEEHHIVIYSDDEVEVYLDGDYMGVTEEGKAEFEKFIGTFELELVRGDETKSYIIQVDNDGEDFVFRRYFE